MSDEPPDSEDRPEGARGGEVQVDRRGNAQGRIDDAAGLLVEFASVVFAVLLALGVNEWWEGREREEQVHRTTDAVVREIRENRSQLARTDSAAWRDQMAGLDSAIVALRAERDPDDLGVDWNVALLSSAAWETAQITGVTRDMSLDHVIELAQLYEFQRYFSRSQDELATLISSVSSRMESEPLAVLLELRTRFEHTEGLRRTLSTIYVCTLVELGRADAEEADACPRETGEAVSGGSPVDDTTP